ncbi:AAA+-type ATPase [Klebsormidium nitens]|uniref:AAA+-type ATPase n=1 Tax=Klebsormidium nitens TaxID=105231 RepID=A0A1Y1IQT8_KLENI|nr:AAA+-type ATPase [Klebsormidium nitens]|eukprot:GAQ91839.1 AAA+-type ATPase [Klebsormidium nitens]
MDDDTASETSDFSAEEELIWTCEDLEKELEILVGLDELKSHLRRWCKGLLLDRQRQKLGLSKSEDKSDASSALLNASACARVEKRMAPNMVFLGNPGTGKTSVARMLARILHKLGVLRRNVVVEVQRTDLVAQYIGQTGPKTREALEKAQGGVLFVDEAYRLVVPGVTNDFGTEALEEIMSQMDSGKLMCIFAGYEAPMKKVLDCNEGFRRRFGKQFVFKDYTPAQIADIILIKMTGPETARSIPGFALAPDCTRACLERLIDERIPVAERRQRNGGLAMTLLQEARERLDERLDVQCADLAVLLTLTLSDFEAAADGMIPVEAVPVAEPTADPMDLMCQLSRHMGSVLNHAAGVRRTGAAEATKRSHEDVIEIAFQAPRARNVHVRVSGHVANSERLLEKLAGVRFFTSDVHSGSGLSGSQRVF